MASAALEALGRRWRRLIQPAQVQVVPVEPVEVVDHILYRFATTPTTELLVQALPQRQIHIIPVVLMQIMIMLAARLYFPVIPLPALNRLVDSISPPEQ